MTDHLMQLSTTVAPAKTFTVDGMAYELLGMDHLSPEAEANVTALLTRYGASRFASGWDEKALADAAAVQRGTPLSFMGVLDVLWQKARLASGAAESDRLDYEADLKSEIERLGERVPT